MSNHTAQQSKTSKDLNLTHGAARRICEKHRHRKAAQEVVDALPYRDGLEPTKVGKLVEEQISMFAQSVIKCVEGANECAGKVEKLPGRREQGAALREIRGALESLRDAVERNWALAKPRLELESTEKLNKFLTTEAIKELLPANLRSEFIKFSDNKVEYQRQQLKLSYLLNAGSRPLTRLIKGAKIAVRRAEQRIPPGASLKAPLDMALILQLADHFEWARGQKAGRTDGGPFSRFCIDVFESWKPQTIYTVMRDIKRCPPKAEATGSNPVGCANN